MNDQDDLLWNGRQIVPKDPSDLSIYSEGSRDPEDPGGQWYLDREPEEPAPPGWVAVIQRHSRCRAHLRQDDILGFSVGGVVGPF